MPFLIGSKNMKDDFEKNALLMPDIYMLEKSAINV